MPKAIQKSAHEKYNLLNEESEVPSSPGERASSDQEADPEVSFQPSRAQQAIPSMLMPHIESPKMDWPVNDDL